MSRTQEKWVPREEIKSGIEEKTFEFERFERSVSILQELVIDGTMGADRLARRLGLNSSVLNEILASLIEGGLVRSEWSGKRRLFSPTEAGFTAIEHYLALRRSIMSDAILTPPQVPDVSGLPAPTPGAPSDRTHLSARGNQDDGSARLYHSSWKARRSNSASLTISETRISMICQGCGKPVSVLRQSVADTLRGPSLKEEHVRAFECDACEAVIFEDELVEGRFVPRSASNSVSQNN